jgi:hypothetical protein
MQIMAVVVTINEVATMPISTAHVIFVAAPSLVSPINLRTSSQQAIERPVVKIQCEDWWKM